MSKVFVVDVHKRPLNPVHPGRARLLLTQGQAAVPTHDSAPTSSADASFPSCLKAAVP
jgi:hypothetical protein